MKPKMIILSMLFCVAIHECAAFDTAANSFSLLADMLPYSPEEAAGFRATLSRHNPCETNRYSRAEQLRAIRGLASVGTADCTGLLACIWRTEGDYAALAAHDAALVIAARFDLTNELVSIAREVATNGTPFRAYSEDHKEGLCRKHLYKTLAGICVGGVQNGSRDCSATVRDAIFAFFCERVLEETGSDCIYLDIQICRAFPSYRTSRQRSDNISRLRNGSTDEMLLKFLDKLQEDSVKY